MEWIIIRTTGVDKTFGGVRKLVSKKKKRYTQDGFDLDLSYITPQIVAMGFPSTGTESLYRNPMPQVEAFFDMRHPVSLNMISGTYSSVTVDIDEQYLLKCGVPTVF